MKSIRRFVNDEWKRRSFVGKFLESSFLLSIIGICFFRVYAANATPDWTQNSTSYVGTLTLGSAGVTTGGLSLANATGANVTTLRAGASAPALTYTFPTVAPTANQFLQSTDVNGTLAWATPSTGVGGSGTNNYIPRWTPNGTTLGNSLFQDNATTVGLNQAPAASQMLTISPGADANNGLVIKGNSNLGSISQLLVGTLNNGNQLFQLGTNTSNATRGTLYLGNNTPGVGNYTLQGVGSLDGNFTDLNVANGGTIYLTVNNNAVDTVTTGAFQLGTTQALQCTPANGSHNTFGTATTADALADNLFATSATTQKGIVIQGKASQTANIFEAQTSTGVVTFAVPIATSIVTGTNNTFIGSGAALGVTSMNNSVVIGQNAASSATASGGNVVIGKDANIGNVSSATVVGTSAATGAGNSVVIGQGSGSINITGTNSTIVGTASGTALTSGNNHVIIGQATGTVVTTGNSDIFIGSGSQGESTGTANTASIGGNNSAITNVYFGSGVTNGTTNNVTIQNTGQIGTNKAGSNLAFSGAAGTGNGEPGLPVVKYPLKVASGTTLQVVSTQNYVMPGVLLSTNADTTVTASVVGTTETTLIGGVVGSQTLEGGMMRSGRLLRVRAYGVYTTSATPPTFRFKVKVGTSIVVDTTAISMGISQTNNAFVLDTVVVCRTYGAGGTSVLKGDGTFLFQSSANAPVQYPLNTGTVSPDLTSNQTVDATITYSAGTAGNSVTASLVTIESLN